MSLEDYMTDISRVPMLTCDEEIILGSQVQEMMQVLRDNSIEESISKSNLSESVEGLSTEHRRVVRRGLKARSRMISANMRLVIAVARKMRTMYVYMTVQDMIQEGAIGLARAAEKFEPNRGYKFSTYAYWWIRQGIVRAGETQEKLIKVPATLQKIAKNVKKTSALVAAETGKQPTFAEIAEIIGEDVDRIEKALFADPVVISLDHRKEEGSDLTSLLDLIVIEDSSQEDDQQVASDRIEFILMLVNVLPKSEQLLIKQRHGIGMEMLSVREIAESTGLSQQSIRQKYQKIINKIRYVATSFPRPNS